MRQILRHIVRLSLPLATICAFTGAFLCWCVSFIPPTEGNFWGIISLSTPVVMVVNALLGFYWFRKRHWAWTLLIVSGLLFNLNFFFSYFQYHFKSKEEADLKIATLNVDNFNYLGTPDETIEEVLEIAKERNLDILCLQEYCAYPQYNIDSTNLIFKKYFPFISFVKGASIMSRHPILGSRHEKFKDSGNDYFRADIKIKEDTIRVISVHLQSTGISSFQQSSKKKVQGEFSIEKVIETLEKNSRKRVSQVGQLRELIDSTIYPVLVVGDFNDTPTSYTYRTLRGELRDGFREKGRGFGRTFRGLGGVLRIDYIFHDEHFRTLRYKNLQDKVSDHLMVTADLRFYPPKRETEISSPEK